MTGKVLGSEWVGHLERRVVAAGGTEQDAHCIYDAFHEAKAAHVQTKKKRASRASAAGGGQEGRDVNRASAARLRAAARKNFASKLQQCEDTVFCLETPKHVGK